MLQRSISGLAIYIRSLRRYGDVKVHALWTAPEVERQPEVALIRWQIFELPDGSRHFCGYHHGSSVHEGRVSSPILKFDPSTMSGFTRSGRSYRLVGPPGADDDADFVKAAWLRFNGFVLADAKPVAAEPIGSALN